MKGKLKKILCLAMAIIMLMPVVVYASGLNLRQARSAATRLNTAIRNYERQLDRINTLRNRQASNYARFIARQELAEARFIQRQQTALANAYDRLTRANGLQARVVTAHTPWVEEVLRLGGLDAVNTAVATTSPEAVALVNLPILTPTTVPRWGVTITDFATTGALAAVFFEHTAIDYEELITIGDATSYGDIGRHRHATRWSDDLWRLLPDPRFPAPQLPPRT